jgi:hypothetical protein
VSHFCGALRYHVPYLPRMTSEATVNDMDPAATIRDRALKLLETDDWDSTTKAAELLKMASEIEQQEANTSKLEADRKKVEQDLSNSYNRWKDLLATATPLFTTVILAGTLIFQISQSHEANKEIRQADAEKRAEALRQAQQSEQTRFTDALKLVQSSEKISPAATILNTFTVEPQRSEARQMGLKLLSRAQSIDDFQDLFSIFEPVTIVDLSTLLQLNRSVEARYAPLATKADAAGKNDTSKMTPAERSSYQTLSAEIKFTSQKIALLLQRPRATGSQLDLSDTSFNSADLKGADLNNANLDYAVFGWDNLDGCDLTQTKNFDHTVFVHTAWWHAARIDRPLLEYLEVNAPYRGQPDYPSGAPVNDDDYAKSLARLKLLVGK